MFTYNDIDLEDVSLSFTERDNGLEFYVEGFDKDKKISIDFMLDLNIDYLKAMEIDYEYDLCDQLIESESYLGINNEYNKVDIEVSIMKDLDERYFLRVTNDELDVQVNFELEEQEEYKEDEDE